MEIEFVKQKAQWTPFIKKADIAPELCFAI